MSTISINEKLQQSIINSLFADSGDGGPLAQATFGSFASGGGYGVLKLMQGTVPTNFSGLTTTSSRSADTLVTWSAQNNAAATSSYPLSITTAYASASQSGVATWFWWYVPNGSSLVLQLVGTVGTAGTDLVIADTTIISGANYRIGNLRFGIPQDYTY